MHSYNETLQHGNLKGLSPNGALRAAIDGGHKRVDVSFQTLAGVFCDSKSRQIIKGKFSFGGTKYYHDALIPLTGEPVEIRIPLIRDKSRILVFDQQKIFRCIAEPEQQFAFGDREGAVEAARRQKIARGYIAGLRLDGGKIDHQEIIAREIAHLPDAPTVEIGAQLSLSDDVEDGGRALVERPVDPREREAAKRRHIELQEETMDRLLEVYGLRAIGGNR